MPGVTVEVMVKKDGEAEYQKTPEILFHRTPVTSAKLYFYVQIKTAARYDSREYDLQLSASPHEFQKLPADCTPGTVFARFLQVDRPSGWVQRALMAVGL